MTEYQVFKVKSDMSLEPMGLYEARTRQDAINKMAERGNISGNEWAMKYIAIPVGIYFQHRTITI